jgi:hypothetical protein
MFDPNSSFAIDFYTDNRRRRRIKEAIYSTINNSFNKHDLIDNAWNIFYTKKIQRLKKISNLR